VDIQLAQVLFCDFQRVRSSPSFENFVAGGPEDLYNSLAQSGFVMCN